MPPNPFFGVVLHAIGGFSAGSFYLPFKRVAKWKWESYWMIQGVLAWVIMPPVAAWLTTPHLGEILAHSPVRSMFLAWLFGALWGIGGLTFGLSMRYLGLSLGYAIALGFCAAFGTLIPPIFNGTAGSLFAGAGGLIVLAGILVCLIGIALCGHAGVCKERELTEEQKKNSVQEFSLAKGFGVAIFAGVMSACMAFAISAGKPIADAAIAAGTPVVYQNNPVFILIMAGGFTTNFIWCLVLNFKNKSGGDYLRGSPQLLMANYVLAGLAGVIWFGQFFFYGMGTTKMGKYDFSSWTIHMAFIIVFSSLWGIYLKEWRGVSRGTMSKVWLGLGVLTLSTVVIGFGNYVAAHPELLKAHRGS